MMRIHKFTWLIGCIVLLIFGILAGCEDTHTPPTTPAAGSQEQSLSFKFTTETGWQAKATGLTIRIYQLDLSPNVSGDPIGDPITVPIPEDLSQPIVVAPAPKITIDPPMLCRYRVDVTVTLQRDEPKTQSREVNACNKDERQVLMSFDAYEKFINTEIRADSNPVEAGQALRVSCGFENTDPDNAPDIDRYPVNAKLWEVLPDGSTHEETRGWQSVGFGRGLAQEFSDPYWLHETWHKQSERDFRCLLSDGLTQQELPLTVTREVPADAVVTISCNTSGVVSVARDTLTENPVTVTVTGIGDVTIPGHAYSVSTPGSTGATYRIQAFTPTIDPTTGSTYVPGDPAFATCAAAPAPTNITVSISNCDTGEPVIMIFSRDTTTTTALTIDYTDGGSPNSTTIPAGSTSTSISGCSSPGNIIAITGFSPATDPNSTPANRPFVAGPPCTCLSAW